MLKPNHFNFMEVHADIYRAYIYFQIDILYRYYICRTLSLYIFIYISIEIYIIYICKNIYILMFCSWGKAVKGQRFSNLKALTHPKLRQLNKHVGCTLCALQFDLNCRPPLLHQRQGLSYIYIYIYMGKTLVVLHSFVER